MTSDLRKKKKKIGIRIDQEEKRLDPESDPVDRIRPLGVGGDEDQE